MKEVSPEERSVNGGLLDVEPLIMRAAETVTPEDRAALLRDSVIEVEGENARLKAEISSLNSSLSELRAKVIVMEAASITAIAEASEQRVHAEKHEQAARVYNKEIDILHGRVQSLLEANNAELERRRAVERDLAMSKVDAEVWRERYHAMREDYLRAERRLCALEGQLPMPFDEAN